MWEIRDSREPAMKKAFIVALLLFIAAPLLAMEDHLIEGGRHLSAGDYKKALRSYERALKVNKDSAEAYKGMGLAYYRMGYHETACDFEVISSAVNAFTKSLALKQDEEVCYLLGLSQLALYEKENAEKAHDCLKSMHSELAGKLAEKITAYAKPPKLFTYTESSASRSAFTSVIIKGNTVLVPVTFSYRGSSVKTMLVLDTGASVTTISEQLAARLGVDIIDTGTMTGIAADGRQIGARWFVADLLSVGPKNLPRVQTAILPGSGGVGYEGLLGMDFLKNFRYHVDFSRKVIDWNN